MNDNLVDKRKFSGHRVLAECEVVVKNSDPFSHYNSAKKGHMVLNVRGGCLYLPEHFTEENIQKIFPDGETAEFTKLSLFAKNKSRIIIEDIKVFFLRIRKCQNREGIVFRFAEITEKQLDILESLRYKFPAINPNEETSVPFEEIFTLERSHNFKLQE